MRPDQTKVVLGLKDGEVTVAWADKDTELVLLKAGEAPNMEFDGRKLHAKKISMTNRPIPVMALHRQATEIEKTGESFPPAFGTPEQYEKMQKRFRVEYLEELLAHAREELVREEAENKKDPDAGGAAAVQTQMQQEIQELEMAEA